MTARGRGIERGGDVRAAGCNTATLGLARRSRVSERSVSYVTPVCTACWGIEEAAATELPRSPQRQVYIVALLQVYSSAVAGAVAGTAVAGISCAYPHAQALLVLQTLL